MNELSEKILWTNFRNGDDSALAEIYKKYADQLFSYGMKITDNEALVKDCIQETFIRLIKKRKTITVSPHIHVYLFKTMRNKLIEEIRTGTRKEAILDLIHYSHPAHENAVEEKIMASEDTDASYEKLKQALATLTDHQKELIHLKYTLGFTTAAIAELLSIDVASVRTLLYRSLKKVRKLLLKSDLHSPLKQQHP